MNKTPTSWTGVLIGKMHNAHVSRKDLADKLNVGKAYITMILNGQRTPKNAESILTSAFNEIVENRKEGKNAKTETHAGAGTDNRV